MKWGKNEEGEDRKVKKKKKIILARLLGDGGIFFMLERKNDFQKLKIFLLK